MPMSQWTTYRQNQFTGENKIPDIEVIQPDQLLVAYNTIATADMTLQTRMGKTRLNETLGDGPMKGLWRYIKVDGSAYLVAQHGTTLYSASWSGGTAAATFVAVKTGLDATAKLRGVVWKDNLILTNGVDNPFRFDGTTCTDLAGSPPKSKYIKVYANRLFFVDAANPNWLRWSGLEDYDAWDALDIIYVRDNDGDVITGMAAQPGGMVIFKNRSAWTLYGTYYEDMQLVQLSDSVGCVAPDSIVDSGVMMGSDNLWLFTLSSLTEFPKTHKSLITILTKTQLQGVTGVAVPFGNRIEFMIDQLCLNFETSTKGMTTWTNINAASFSVADGPSDDGSLLIGDKTSGIVYALNNEANDDGTVIPTEIWTPYNDLGSTREKLWRIFLAEITVLNGSNTDNTATIFMKYDIDRGEHRDLYQSVNGVADALTWSSGEDWDAKQWGPTDTSIRWPMHNARGNRGSFKISTRSRIKFEGYKMQYREVGKLL